MTSIVIIEPSGNIKTVSIKNTDESELYKKCGFKSANHFAKQASWDIVFNTKSLNVRLYAKIEGRVNSKNLYKFPMLNNISFYGKCLLICYQLEESTNIYNCTSMKEEMWNNIYKQLTNSDIDTSTNTNINTDTNTNLTNNISVPVNNENIALELKEEEYLQE